MALSLGLMISLGFTTLLCLLLFLYIRQRAASIDTKLNSLFKIVQDEVSNNNTRLRTLNHLNQQQSMTVTEVPSNMKSNNGEIQHYNDDSSISSSSSVENSDTDDDLISVSSGDDEDDESDNEQEHDDSMESENNTKVIHTNINDTMKDEVSGHLKTLSDLNRFSKIMNNDTNQEHENNKGNDNEDNEDNLEVEEELDELDDIESLELIDNDENLNEASDITTTTNGEGENNESNIEQGIINVKKLSVSQLRNIVAEKNLHENPKKLKKSELVELLNV